MCSRPGKWKTACSLFVTVWIRLAASETGTHAVITLGKRDIGLPWRVQIPQRSGTPHRLAWPALARVAHAPPAREGPPPKAPSGAPGAPRLTHPGAAGRSCRPPGCAPIGGLALRVRRTAYPQSPSTAASRSAASPFVSPTRAVRPSLRSSAVCFSVAGCWRQGASASTRRATPRCRA